MCGIAGLYIKDPSKPGMTRKDREQLIDRLFVGLEKRGRHATGMVVSSGTKTQLVKKDVSAVEFIKRRPKVLTRPDMILLHTRWATQGPPANNDNNHPVVCGSVFAVHNGHVANDWELFDEHDLTRNAQVDSEIIPQLFNKFGLDKAHLALQELEGGVATAVIDPQRFPHTMVVAKGESSPVVYWETDVGLIFASESSILSDAVNRTFGKDTVKYGDLKHMTGGELLLLEDGGMEKLSFKVKKRVYTSYKPTSSTSSAGENWQDWYSRKEADAEKGNDTGLTRSGDYQRLKLGLGCSCGDTRYWHSGPTYDGTCLKAKCRCTEFVEAEKQSPVELAKSSGATATRKTFTIFDTQKNGSVTYIACSTCKTAQEIDKITTYAGYDFCKECWGDDGFVAGGEAREEPTQPPVEQVEAKVDEADMIAQLIADEFDTTPFFVKYLLFDAPAPMLNTQEHLMEMYELFSDAWIKHETRIMNGEEATPCTTKDDAECGVTVFADGPPTPTAETV
jgi:hypothetical protein